VFLFVDRAADGTVSEGKNRAIPYFTIYHLLHLSYPCLSRHCLLSRERESIDRACVTVRNIFCNYRTVLSVVLVCRRMYAVSFGLFARSLVCSKNESLSNTTLSLASREREQREREWVALCWYVLSLSECAKQGRGGVRPD
jgi:hypothetical protein